MSVLLVRNQMPGPLILVDERGGDRQEFSWEPNGHAAGGDLLEVPKELASSIHFRRVVQKGHLSIEREIDDDLALMGPSDSDWINRQQALTQGEAGMTTQFVGRTSDGVEVLMDKTSTAPISTMTLDENGEIITVAEVTPEARQEQRGRGMGQAPADPAPQPEPVMQQMPSGFQPQPSVEGVPSNAGGHLDPNAP